MEAFVRIFLHGEALQRVFACVCNNSNCDVQNKIGRIVSSISRTTLCIRLTPIGLAPFRNDITMVLPYSMMDGAQLDFLGTIMDQATFVASSHAPAVGAATGNSIRAMGIGNEVVVVTMLDGIRIWSDSPSSSAEGDMPLSHRHATAAQVRGPPEQILLFPGMVHVERAQAAREVRAMCLFVKSPSSVSILCLIGVFHRREAGS
jgi:hypothetical protein